MAQEVQARRQSPRHSTNYVKLHSCLQEAFSSRDMPLPVDEARSNFYSPRLLSGSPSPCLRLVNHRCCCRQQLEPIYSEKALKIQLQKLILEPLQQVSKKSKQPIVIIIDGLDKCEGEDVQSNFLRILGSVLQRPSVGGCERICFIVTSRPEPWIHD